MRLKVKLKFIEPWSQVISQVAKQCNMTPEEYCRRAVQVLTKQGLEEGERRNAKPTSTNSAGDASQVRTSDVTDSNALANETNT